MGVVHGLARSLASVLSMAWLLGAATPVASAQAAEIPLALRVDTEVRGSGPDGTVTALTVTVAPADRARLGERARVTIEPVDSEDLHVVAPQLGLTGDGLLFDPDQADRLMDALRENITAVESTVPVLCDAQIFRS